MMVADSDVLLDFLEGRGPTANRIALELDRGRLRTTVITRFELLAGAKIARQLKLVGELLAALPCLPLDEPVSTPRPRSVEPWIEMASALAWPTVSSPGSSWPVLLTRNRRHLGRVLGLALGRIGRTEGD